MTSSLIIDVEVLDLHNVNSMAVVWWILSKRLYETPVAMSE